MKTKPSFLTELQLKEVVEFTQTIISVITLKEKMYDESGKVLKELDAVYMKLKTILIPGNTVLISAQREELIKQHELFEKASADSSGKAFYVDKLNEFDSFCTSQLKRMEKEKNKKKRGKLFAPLGPMHNELKELAASAQVSVEIWIKQFELLKKNISKYNN